MKVVRAPGSRPAVRPAPVQRAKLAAWLAAAAWLASACGGGAGAPPPDFAPPVVVDGPAADAASPCVAAVASTGAVTVSGVATFISVPNNAVTGGLNYAAAAPKPIRAATAQLLNTAGSTLASCVTNDAGAYAFSVPGATGDVRVRVRAEMKKDSAGGGQWDFSVRDNTRDGALYVLDSPLVTPVLGGLVQRNVQADSGFGGAAYTSIRAAGPFAILDTTFVAMKKVLSVAPDENFPALKLFWSVRNAPAKGSAASGNIGTSFYQLDPLDGHELFLLGAENVDTDEYDSHVVAHEWGHYFQSAFSRDDSIGGIHGSGDKLDMRVAFSEGWGNAWSGMALGSPVYADSADTGQARGSTINVSQPPGVGDQGWFSESSIQFLMWNFHESSAIGFAPIFTVMTGPLKTSNSFTAIHSFASLLKAAAPGGAAAINTLLQGQKISTQNDAFGVAETNNGGVALALPLYQAAAGQHCVSNAAGTPNKLGNTVFIQFQSSGTRTLTVRSVAGQTNADPDFALVKSDGTRELFLSEATDAELAANVILPVGTHTLALSDFKLPDKTQAQPVTRCFTLTIQ